MDIRSFFGGGGGKKKTGSKPPELDSKPKGKTASTTSTGARTATSRTTTSTTTTTAANKNGKPAAAAARKAVSSADFFATSSNDTADKSNSVNSIKVTPPTGPTTTKDTKTHSRSSPSLSVKRKDPPPTNLDSNNKSNSAEANDESDDSVIILNDTHPSTDDDNNNDNDDDKDYAPPSNQAPSRRSSPRRLASKNPRTLLNNDPTSPPKSSTNKRSSAATPTSTSSTQKKAKTSTSLKRTNSQSKHQVHKQSLLQPSLSLDSFSIDAATPQCLLNITFVLTGTFPDGGLSRDAAVELIKILGGRVTTAVSKNTDYLLVCGPQLEDGRPVEQGKKYQRALELTTTTSDPVVILVHGVPQFYGLLQQYSDDQQQQQQQLQQPQQSPVGIRASAGANNSPPAVQAADFASKPPPQSSATATATATTVPAASSTKKANPYDTTSSSGSKSVMSNPYANRKMATTAVNPYAKRAPTVINNSSSSSTMDAKPAALSNTRSKNNNQNQLWVDRYKPTSSREILGNEAAVRQLKGWLQSWERVFNKDDKVGKSFAAPQGPWKAALLSGPPGIGSTYKNDVVLVNETLPVLLYCWVLAACRNSLTLSHFFYFIYCLPPTSTTTTETTTATLVAMEAGRDVLEFNASDVRSKKAMQDAFGDITGSHTLHFGSSSNSKSTPRQKRCIIMDEVDGMGAGDRSGMSELIQLIKHSRVPIICICNDRQSQKMKSLLPYCMDLRYKRPVKSTIAKRALEVALREGLVVEPNAAEAIVESCGNDVRQVLNCLQMWASNSGNKTSTGSGSDVLTYKSLKEREHSINKDEILRVSLFDAAKTIVEGRRGLVGSDSNAERSSFMKRNEAFFVDYSFMGLLVQQNYLKIVQGQFNDAKRRVLAGSNADVSSTDPTLDVLERMHQAADAMSDFAMTENALRGGQNWSLLPTAAMLAVKTGYHAGGETGGFLGGFPEFTTWLGRNSSRNKKLRLLGELGHHMNYRVSGGTSEIRLSYLPVLRDRFLTLLTNEETQGGSLSDAIELMDEYGLDRDDIFEKLDEFKMDSSIHTFAKMDSKTKAAFTRTYNAGTHRSQALVAEQGAGKKAKRGAAGSSAASFATKDPDAIDDDEVEGGEEQGEDDDELDAEKVKALFASKKRSRKAAGTGGTNGKAASKKPRAKTSATTKKKK